MRAQEVQEANELLQAAITCHHEFRDFDLRFRSKLERWLGDAYGIAYGLYRNGTAWRKFTEADLWKGRRKRPRQSQKHIEKALIWTMRFMLSDGRNDNYHRAYTYARGLQVFWERGDKPEDIPRLIKEHGGIEALSLSAAKEASRARERKAANRSFLSDLDEQDTNSDDSRTTSDAEHTQPVLGFVGRIRTLEALPLDERIQECREALDHFHCELVTYLYRIDSTSPAGAGK